jgi:tetratricopeptide (TPR) repeat protein
MSNRRSRPVDPIIRLFREVSGDDPDADSLARMCRVSSALSLRDNDALWLMIAVLEYYARLYEAMPERIRWASEGSLEAARREVGGATDALMQQHRDALERCKATIQLAEKLIQEHEARYRVALANLNETALIAVVERVANQVTRSAGNRLIGAAAASAREQRERLDEAIDAFGQAVEAAATRTEAMATQIETRLARWVRCMTLGGGAVFLLMLLVAGVLAEWHTGRHLAGAECRAEMCPHAGGSP